MPVVQRLTVDDVELVATIDRSEPVDVEYEVVDGELRERPVRMAEIPAWDLHGTGPHSVAKHVDDLRTLVARGAHLLAAMDGTAVMGLAVVDPVFDPPLAWLAFLHVSRPHRRKGAASALWRTAVGDALAAGADELYVSAIPTGSAIGFYLSRGCRLADPIHPVLFAKEPEDIHLVCPLT